MRLRGFLLAATGAVLLAACGYSGEYYEKSPQQVADAIAGATLPIHILGSSVAGSHVSRPDAGTVITALLDASGAELMRFVTTITPEGTGSRVLTVVEPPVGDNKARASEAMQANSYEMGMMDSLAKEHVAAAVEGRAFDMLFATNPVAKGMLRADPEMRAQIDQANEAAMEFSRMETDMAEAATDGYDSAEPAFGEPMDDARGSY